MAEMSNYLEEKIINLTLRGQAYTAPASVWLALYTTDPSDADTGTECTGGSYQRQQITFSAPTDGTSTNSAELEYDAATTDWGTIGYVGIHDASTGGNLLYHSALTVAKPIAEGDIFKVQVNNLSVTVS